MEKKPIREAALEAMLQHARSRGLQNVVFCDKCVEYFREDWSPSDTIVLIYEDGLLHIATGFFRVSIDTAKPTPEGEAVWTRIEGKESAEGNEEQPPQSLLELAKLWGIIEIINVQSPCGKQIHREQKDHERLIPALLVPVSTIAFMVQLARQIAQLEGGKMSIVWCSDAIEKVDMPRAVLEKPEQDRLMRRALLLSARDSSN